MSNQFFDLRPMFLLDYYTNDIMDVSSRAIERYGFSKEEFTSMKITDLGELVDSDAGTVTSAIVTDTDSVWSHKSKSGEKFLVRLSLHQIQQQDQVRRLGIVHEVNVKPENGRRGESSNGKRRQKSSSEDFKMSIESYKALFDSMGDAICLYDKKGRFIEVNNGTVNMYGYEKSDFVGEDLNLLAAPGKVNIPQINERFKKALKGKPQRFEFWGRRRNGEDFPQEVILNPGYYFGQQVIIAISRDITNRKNAEEKIRRSLKEKEVLLAEIHHRVKNNLAVVTGLLELQREHSTNEGARSILKDSQMRIYSMALIHEKLYQSENLSQIQFDKYIRELVDVIDKSHVTDRVQVNFHIEVEAVPLTIKQAIPCGLLLNEILTNSLKHAFPNNRNGEIKILFRVEEEKLLFEVSDDGIGLPDDFETIKFRSLGVTLINTLSKQLGARLQVHSENGTKYSILFDCEK